VPAIKERFYDALEHVFHKFPKYHVITLLGNFNAKVGRDDLLKPPFGNENLHEISNDNAVKSSRL
jgi:hypothetical protein